MEPAESKSYEVACEPCPTCGSKNNLKRYSDGHAYCFTYDCDHWEPSEEGYEAVSKPKNKKLPLLGEFQGHAKRGISEETCRKMKYSVGSYTLKKKDSEIWETVKAHIVHVPDQLGQPVASKVRMAGKEFRFVGDCQAAGLVFQDIWPAGCSKKIVITEGEFDSLSVAEVQACKYAVVSLPNGVKNAAEVLGRAKDYLNSFSEIVLMFDMDKPGREAAKECSKLMPHKTLLAETSGHDANAMLKAGDRQGILNAIFNAQPYTPEGVVRMSSLREEMKKEVVVGRPWIYEQLTKHTFGRRYGEVYFIGAGVGVGKTDFCLQQIVADMMAGTASAMFLLEQPVVETGKRLVGKFAGKLYHIPPASGGGSKEDFDRDMDALLDLNDPFLYDHFGAKDWPDIEDNIRFLAVSHGVKDFWIDHVTALVAHETDEQKALISMCADMSGLAQELGVNLYVVSHLATPFGKSHEEGAIVLPKHYKGSRAIAQWAHYMFALERNTLSENLKIRQTTTFRIVKDRFTGRATGETFLLGYKPAEGLQYELSSGEVAAYNEMMAADGDDDNVADGF